MASTADDFSKYLDSLPAGADVFESLKATISMAAGSSALTNGLKGGALWSLVAAHAVVALLAIVGIGVKYCKRTGWLFVRDQSTGLWRPSASILPNAFSALYAVFFLITVPTCLLNPRPTPSASLFATFSYIPIGFAFHCTVMSTVGVSLSTTSSVSPWSTAPRWRLPSLIGLWTALAFVLSHVPILVCIKVWRKEQQEIAAELLGGIDSVKASGLGLIGLVGLAPAFQKLEKLSNVLFTLYRVEIGLYGFWAIVWMAVYIPAALRILLHLRLRHRRLTRGIRSIKVLDELVTNNDLEAAKSEQVELEPDLIITNRPPSEDSVPKLPPLAPSSPISLAFMSASPSPTLVSSPQSGTNFRLGPQRTERRFPVESRTGSRIAELQADLAKVKRTLWTVVLSFSVCSVMVLSFLPFCFVVVSGHYSIISNGAYQIWIGWTFAGPAHVSSSAFLYFALVGPSPSPSPPPATPSNSAAPLRSDFSPTSPLFVNPARPPQARERVARSPRPSRQNARALFDFFGRPNPLIRGAADGERSSSSLADSASRSRSPSVPTMIVPAPPRRGRKSRPPTAESLVDPTASGVGLGFGAIEVSGAQRKWVPSAFVEARKSEDERPRVEEERHGDQGVISVAAAGRGGPRISAGRGAGPAQGSNR